MTLVVEDHPDLLTAQFDLELLVNQLYRGCSLSVKEAAKLSNLVREITLGHTPETLQASAEAVTAAGAALAVSTRLDRVLTERERPRDPSAARLMSGAHAIVAVYAQATLDTDEALWDSILPARAA